MKLLDIFKKKPTEDDRNTDLMLHALEEGFCHLSYNKKHTLIESKNYGFIVLLHQNLTVTIHDTASFRMIACYMDKRIHKKFGRLIKKSEPILNITHYPVDMKGFILPKEQFLETLPDYLFYKS